MGKYDQPIGTSGIEWTNRTWNPTTGCDKVSQGCKFCYAEPLALRLQRMKNPRYATGFDVALHRDKISEPAKWRDAEWVFVNSMSDLLHRDIPDEFIVEVFRSMASNDWHRYQALTKRPERWGHITEIVTDAIGYFPANVLPGTSVEDKRALARLPMLARAGDDRSTRMISVEPLLESLCDGDVNGLAQQLTDGRVGWVITGGEAGWHARPAVEQWFREVRDACNIAKIPFFHKQFGGVGTTKLAKRGGTLAELDGVLHHAMPDVWRGRSPNERRDDHRELAL